MAEEKKDIQFTDSTTDLSEGESNATLGEKAWYVVNTYSTHENTTTTTTLRTHVDDVVSLADDIEVVFDDDNGIAAVYQSA